MAIDMKYLNFRKKTSVSRVAAKLLHSYLTGMMLWKSFFKLISLCSYSRGSVTKMMIFCQVKSRIYICVNR